MKRVDDERHRAVDGVVRRAREWALRTPDALAVLVVGSYAAGTPRPDSDLDLVVVTQHRSAHLRRLDPLIGAIVADGVTVRRQDWGPVHECRVRMPDGLEVELGVTGPEWLAVPVDPGTERVLRDGCRIVLDRGPTAMALASLGLSPTTWQGS